MANVAFKTVEGSKGIRNGDIFGYWDLRAGDVALPLICPRFNDKSIYMFGTWDSMSITLHGGNDPDLASFAEVYDFEGTTITQNADRKAWVILPNLYAIKPIITGGGAGAQVRVALVGRGAAV